MDWLIRVYLDTCCFSRLYDNLTDPTIYDEAQAVLQIQDKVANGQVSLAWSYVLDIETFRNPFLQRRHEIILWGDIASYTVKHCNNEIEALSIALQARGIKTYDSLHVACAVALYCDYFITTDRKLLITPIAEIQVVNPVDFIDTCKGKGK